MFEQGMIVDSSFGINYVVERTVSLAVELGFTLSDLDMADFVTVITEHSIERCPWVVESGELLDKAVAYLDLHHAADGCVIEMVDGDVVHLPEEELSFA
jgi:hypothetical protein